MTTDPVTTPDRPDLLIGTWVRITQDQGRSPRLGVLTRARPTPGRPGHWLWALRSPQGPMVGGPALPVTPLTRAHRADVRRARRQLRDRLAFIRAALQGHDAGAGPAQRALTQTLADQTLLEEL